MGRRLRRAAALLALGSMGAVGCGDAGGPDVGAGISRELAEHRARTLSEI